MKAIVQVRYGAPGDVLELQDVDEPVVEDNAVLVRVHATSVNPADWHFMRGEPRIARLQMGLRKPKETVPGSRSGGARRGGRQRRHAVAAGRRGVRELFMRGGAFAEYASRPAGHARDRSRPASRSSRRRPSRSPRHGAAGSARPRADRARATGPDHRRVGRRGHVRRADRQGVRRRGHRRVQHEERRPGPVARRRPRDRLHPATTSPTASGATTSSSTACGNRSPVAPAGACSPPTGRLVADQRRRRGTGSDPMVRSSKPRLLSPFVEPEADDLHGRAEHEDLQFLTELIEAGTVTPVIDRTYPLSRGPGGPRAIWKTGHARGKVVITTIMGRPRTRGVQASRPDADGMRRPWRSSKKSPGQRRPRRVRRRRRSRPPADLRFRLQRDRVRAAVPVGRRALGARHARRR